MVGSAARDDLKPESDIDVLVTFAGAGQLFDRYFSLKEGLEALFLRPVDVIMDEAVSNPLVRENLDRDRLSVYVAESSISSSRYSPFRTLDPRV
ncbi:MAG: nucleotidyltransferase domain-containing protein [candidate division Zixibacteria bacterium]|nr:nucleotidyltransferase domain-containing protein [candidate division Zixibacteria bacterium]